MRKCSAVGLNDPVVVFLAEPAQPDAKVPADAGRAGPAEGPDPPDDDEDELLRIADIMKLTKYTRQHIDRMIREKRFPSPTSRPGGPKAARRWKKSVVMAW